MKNLIYSMLSVSLIIMFVACSSNSNDTEQEEDLGSKEHFTLRINGSGLTDETVVLFRDTIDSGSGGVRFSGRNYDGYSFSVTLATPIEANEYTLIPYNNTKKNISSVIIPGSGIFLSKDGSVNISNITTNDNCSTYSGNFTINYRRQDNSPGEVSVQGDFEVPTYTCELQ